MELPLFTKTVSNVMSNLNRNKMAILVSNLELKFRRLYETQP